MSRLTQARLFNSRLFPTQTPQSSLQRLQQAFTQGKATLAEYHLEGGRAETLSKKNSWLVDQLIIQAWHVYFPAQSDQAKTSPTVIAVGGYGRQELNLESDIDLLILYRTKPTQRVLNGVENFIRLCWDVKLKVGHNTLTLSECINLAKAELSVMTNYMEARMILGDQTCYEALQIALRDDSIWPVAEFFESKLAEQQARHLRFSDTAYNLEPNIKESPGGLRDLHMISWVANRKFSTSDLSDLVEHGLLTPDENKTLLKGRAFLWTLRNGLHLLSGRCEDRLLFDYQRELAKQLGYRSDAHHLAVEKMMKRYYRTVKELQLLSELALQYFQETILEKPQKTKTKLDLHFHLIGGFLEATNPKLFEEKPNQILSLFHVLQKHPEVQGIRASTVRNLRNNLKKIDQNFRKDPENLTTFLNIFKQQDGLTHALRRMNAYGVLGAFFPEFGKIVGQMQHDLFHIFTVDAHSLFVVGNLRGLMLEKNKDQLPILRNILSKQNHRERLFLAALCHDIGKGSGQDHSIVGEKIALSLCKKLGLSTYDTIFTAWLVRNHLIMSWTAQREDISDPRVIDKFAQLVSSQEHLDNLYLLTVADIRGTSDKVWNEWKGQLLENLYSATSRRLRSGVGGDEAIAQKIEDRKQAIIKILHEKIPEKQLKEIWQQFDQDYFLRNGPNTCAWHIEKIASENLFSLPVVATRYRPEIKAEQILVVAPESDYLLSHSTAIIDQLGLSILDARIHSTKSRLHILVFITTLDYTENLCDQALQSHEREIKKYLLTPKKQYSPRRKSLPRAHKQFQIPTILTFTDNDAIGHTTLELTSQDRPGLLHHVASALLTCKVHLLSAKVSTVGLKAEDTFLVCDRDGNPVSSKSQRKCLEKTITKALR